MVGISNDDGFNEHYVGTDADRSYTYFSGYADSLKLYASVLSEEAIIGKLQLQKLFRKESEENK